MPISRKRYPDNWAEISRRIRFERAGGLCECRGECGHEHQGGRCNAPHGETVHRNRAEPWVWRREPSEGFYPVRIILTTAHLDHDRSNNNDANLRALCQFCHLNHDRLHGAALRRQRTLEAGQLEFEF
jgi:5-methylcytosine-specific restriction endonuclease McrA